MEKRNFDTVSEAVNDLTKRGYADNLSVKGKRLSCEDKNIHLDPDDFMIDEFYRFEGDSDPADETVVYAISSTDKKVKGILVNAFGPYSDNKTDQLIDKLQIKR